MSDQPIRVLVVDDSAFARKVVREVLEASPGIRVIGAARDGLDALEKIVELQPDVITLDLEMPELDGLGLLATLPKLGGPRVVVVSTADGQGELALAALQAGAVDIVHKPTALATDRLYEVGAELVAKVRAAAEAQRPTDLPSPRPSPPVTSTSRRTRLVVIGTSTGGPRALTQLVPALPADFPAPVAIALHIPPGYTEALARRLDERSAIDVAEVSDGLVLRPGLAVIARAGMHLRVERRGDETRARLDFHPAEKLYRPSVDILFQSAAVAWGPLALGVVLTGMGDDGLEGARAIRAAGGAVLTESRRTCVVYGMPRCVVEAGLSTKESPIEEMAGEIASRR